MKNLLAALLVCTVASTAFAAGTSESGDATASPSDEAVAIHWMLATQQDSPLKDSAPTAYLESKFNVDFEFEEYPPRDQYPEKLNLAIASRNLPDMMSRVARPNAIRFGSEGAFVELGQYVDSEVPNLAAILDESPTMHYEVFSVDEEMYTFPVYAARSVPNVNISILEPEFDAIGADDVSTWESFHQALLQLKETHEGSYPLNLRAGNYGSGMLRSVVTPGFTGVGDGIVSYDKDLGEYVVPVALAEYREAMEFMATLYADGILNPEYLTITMTETQGFLREGSIFAIIDFIGGLAGHAPSQEIVGGTLRAIPLPHAEGRDPAYFGVGQNLYGSNGTAVASTVEESKLDRVLELWNFFYSEEWHDAMYFNPEITMEVDGRRQWKPEYYGEQSDEINNYWVPWGYHAHTQSDYLLNQKPGTPYYDYLMEMTSPEALAHYISIGVPVLPFTEDELERIGVLEVAVRDHLNANLDRFIMGRRQFSEWDEFVQEALEKGATELADLYNETYQKYY